MLYPFLHFDEQFTHWGRVTHICVGKLTIIGSDNGLSPGRQQAIIWTNAGIWFIGPLGTNINEIVIEIQTFSFKKMHLKMSFGKWRPSCLGLNVLNWVETTCMWYSSTQSRVTLYTAGHLHTAVPHCSHSRAPIVHTAVPRENNEHGCVYLRCRAVCKLPGCVEGHPWQCLI